jgi:hypothetical protein
MFVRRAASEPRRTPSTAPEGKQSRRVYIMATNESTTSPRRPSFLGQLIWYAFCLLGICSLAVTLVAGLPMAIAQWNSLTGQSLPLNLPAQASPAPAPAPRLVVQPFQPALPQNGAQEGAQAVPTQSYVQVEATSLAIYHATAQAAEPNVDALPADAPAVEYGSRANSVAPAGPNVATAEPLPVVNDQFGSKQAPVDIQGTHTCLHGQVWTDSGCHRPTPEVQP